MSKRIKISQRPITPTRKSSPPPGAKKLQDRLHTLLTLLGAMADLIKTWPESDGDDASVHVETTTKLMTMVSSVVTSLREVEGVIKADAALKKSLQECKIPINLLDLLDHGNGLNPDCFSRGLLREALGQLDGLRRRKLALEKLGAVIQTGLNQRDIDAGNKNENSRCDADTKEQHLSDALEPAIKKARTS